MHWGQRKRNWMLVGVVALTMLMGQTGQASEGIWIDRAELQAVGQGTASPFYPSKEKLIRYAEKRLKQPIPLITDKETVPESGDKHDYTSLATYYWPDQSKPDGLQYVQHDGLANPERNDESCYDIKRMQRMMDQIRDLARGYAVSGQQEYADRAVEIASAWFINPETRMNPNLEHAQLVPGRNDGRSTGIIDTVSLIDVVDSLNLLQGAEAYTPERQKAVKAWFRDYTDWLLHSEKGQKEGQARNNHGIWYDAQVAVYAQFAGQPAIARKIIRAVPEKRLTKQIAVDGSMPLELARTRPMNYSLYVLRAYLALARVGSQIGVDLYDARTARGQGLTDAIDFILPYAEGKAVLPKKDIVEWKPGSFLMALHLANQHYQRKDYEPQP